MEHELLHRRAVLVLSGTVRMRSASSLMKHCFGDRRENWAAFPTFHFHHQKARSRFPAAAFAAEVAKAHTVLWNGPMGAFETEPFDTATVALAKTAAALTQDGSLTSVAGGGDTVAALAHAGVKDEFTFVSTAGGAFLEWMEGKDLPGVAALTA